MTTNAHADADHAGSGGTSITDHYTVLVEKMKPCPLHVGFVGHPELSCPNCGGSGEVPVLPGLRQECPGEIIFYSTSPCECREGRVRLWADNILGYEEFQCKTCEGRGWVARPYELGLLLEAMEEEGYIVLYDTIIRWRVSKGVWHGYGYDAEFPTACLQAVEAWEVQHADI
mgnify:CR=1 FL=1